MTLAYKNTREVEELGDALETDHILRVKRFDPAIAANWNYTGTATDSSHGTFDSCEIVPGVNRLVVEGWTKLPDRDGPADYVLFTICGKDGTPKPFLVIPSDTRVRPDVKAALKSKHMLHSGFRQGIAARELPMGQFTISAWAVDAKHWAISPVGPSFVLNRTVP